MTYSTRTIVSGGVDTPMLYRLTTLDSANMVGEESAFFNSKVVSWVKSGVCAQTLNMFLALAVGASAHAKKIDGSNTELLRQQLPANPLDRPMFDPVSTHMWA